MVWVRKQLYSFFSAFEKAPKEYHWEKAYPQILEDESDMEDGKTAVQKLNKIFKEAEIDNKVIKNLGEGMKKLSSSASGLGDVLKEPKNTISKCLLLLKI